MVRYSDELGLFFPGRCNIKPATDWPRSKLMMQQSRYMRTYHYLRAKSLDHGVSPRRKGKGDSREPRTRLAMVRDDRSLATATQVWRIRCAHFMTLDSFTPQMSVSPEATRLFSSGEKRRVSAEQ